MNNPQQIALIVGGIALAVFLYAAFGWEAEYEDHDTSDIVPEELFAEAIGLLEESESWPVQLSDGNVEVKSSTDHYPVRTVRYEIKELDTTMEEAIAYVRDHSYGGLERRVTDEKYEDTLWQPEDTVGHPTQWVRRSVHLAPPPGAHRDAVVLYIEHWPDPDTWLLGFHSVETINGKEFKKEDAVRAKVMPSAYKLERLPNGKIRVRKIETIDSRGAFSPWFNNVLMSKIFFRNYMFQQAKAMRDKYNGTGTAS